MMDIIKTTWCGTREFMHTAGKLGRAVIVGTVLMIGSAEARTYEPAPLPDYTYIDTEVSTNVPISMANAAIDRWGVGVTFLASASNNVEIAFGRDRDGDGRLGLGEAVFASGWDSGKYFVRGPQGAFTRAVGEDEIGVESVMTLEFAVKGQVAQTVTASVGGEDFFAVAGEGQDGQVVAHAAALWMFDPSWNLMRVLVRGVEGAGEHIVVFTRADGMKVIVR